MQEQAKILSCEFVTSNHTKGLPIASFIFLDHHNSRDIMSNCCPLNFNTQLYMHTYVHTQYKTVMGSMGPFMVKLPWQISTCCPTQITLLVVLTGSFTKNIQICFFFVVYFTFPSISSSTPPTNKSTSCPNLRLLFIN